MRPLLTALGLVAAWEALVWLTGVPPYILPPPSRVAVVLVGRFDLLIEQAAWTATEMILGLALGLPREMVFRHPFPGPGLGVRILGAVNREFADLLRRADSIFIEELRNTPVGASAGGEGASNWYDATSQAFAVFLPVKSVGVMGDGRTYEYVVALRAVQTSDFMTAQWAELPHALLGRVANRIINEVRGINRVVYDISSKPPATIEWE